MLIVTAVNVTINNEGYQVLYRENGTADYKVEVAVNTQPPIFKGAVKNHVRDEGASALLRRIADEMDRKTKKKKK